VSAARYAAYARHAQRRRRAEMKAKIARRELTENVRNLGGAIPARREGVR
jgi:hypothetical protein